ncbi:MAG: hypothetical protein JWP13_615, partial [Candidatus Saccharibacteria bacterium]|nr:hypothetical protein [Candidatus Saccharibacteria bacterium]
MTRTDARESLFSIGILLLVGVLLAVPFLVQSHTVMPIFDFRFNPFALLSLLGLTTNIVVMTLLVRRQKKSFDSLWLIGGTSAVIV